MRKIFAILLVVIVLCTSVNTNVLTAEAAESPYLIMVNRAANCITVYTQDANGEFTLPVIAFVCSTGRNNRTRTGTFTTTDTYAWRKMIGGVYTQYATRFDGGRLFHSIPYYRQKPNSLEWDQYNRLGEQASAGCIRLSCIDAKWIYDHCGANTKVIVYDDLENPGPLGKPSSMQLSRDDAHRGWDPTDPNPSNPWAEVRPQLQLVANTAGDNVLYLPIGSTPEMLQASIGMFSADGTVLYNPGTYGLEIYGRYDLSLAGNYQIYVRGFDLTTGLRADQTWTLCVYQPAPLPLPAITEIQ